MKGNELVEREELEILVELHVINLDGERRGQRQKEGEREKETKKQRKKERKRRTGGEILEVLILKTSSSFSSFSCQSCP